MTHKEGPGARGIAQPARGFDLAGHASNTAASTEDQAGASAALAEHATAIRRLRKRAIADVIEIGQRLTEAQKICGHGNWLPWLSQEFGWTGQSALNYMRVAELNKSKTVLDLDAPVKALYLLAAPSTPKKARDAIIESAKTGPVSVAEVKETIATAKGRKPAKQRRRGGYGAPRKVDRQSSKIADKHAARVILNITVALDTVDDLLAIDKLSDREGFEQHLRALAARMLALADRVVASANAITVRADVEATLPENAVADPAAEVYGPFDPFALIPVAGGDRRTKVAS